MVMLHEVLPHKEPALLISSLDSVSDQGAQATVCLGAECIHANTDGSIEPIVFMEMMAQCFAAASGAVYLEQGKPAPAWGYLAAFRDFKVLAPAFVKEALQVTVSINASLGGVTSVEGQILRGETMLACGQFKVFVPETETE